MNLVARYQADDGSDPIGLGSTKEAAIADLQRQLTGDTQ